MVPDPLVSIVIPAYNAEAFIEKTLKSLANQTYTNIEVIVVDDGSNDGTQQVVSSFSEADSRFRVFGKQNGGPSAARNFGINKAVGDCYLFMDSDDYIDANTVELMVDAVIRDGVDLVLVGYDMVRSGKRKRPAPWIQSAFSHERHGFVLTDFPSVLVKSTVWGCLYDATFYKRAGLRFREDILYEDQPFMAEAFAKASSGVSLIPFPKYHWVQRDGSITHVVDLEDLEMRLNSARLSLDLLKRYSTHEVYEARLLQILGHDLLTCLRRFNKVSEEFNSALVEELPSFYAELEDKTTLDDAAYVAWELLEKGDTETLALYFADTNGSNAKLRIVQKDGKPVIDWTPYAYLGDLHSNGNVLEESLLPRANLFRVVLQDGALRVWVQAYISNICPTEFDYDVELVLSKFDETTGHTIGDICVLSPVEREDWPETRDESKTWWADYSKNFYVFDIPKFWGRQNECFVPTVRIAAAGLKYEVKIEKIRDQVLRNLPLGDTRQLRIKQHKRVQDFYYFKCVPLATLTFESSERAGILYRDLNFRIKSGSRLETAVLEGTGPESVKLLNPGEANNVVKLNSGYPVTLGIGERLEAIRPVEHSCRNVRFVSKNGNSIDARIKANGIYINGRSKVVLSRTAAGKLSLVSRPVVVVKDVRVKGGTLGLKLRAANFLEVAPLLTIRLVDGSSVAEFERLVRVGSDSWIDLPLSDVPPLGLALGLGSYAISFKMSDGRRVEPIYDYKLLKSMPISIYDENGVNTHKIKYSQKKNFLVVKICKYMPDDAKGGYGYGKLMAEYKNATVPVQPNKVLMRTYYGENVTDNALALTYAILRSGRTDLDIYWVTKDIDTPIPEGTHRVIADSPEWFYHLATAGTILENVHQVDYFKKRPGQRVVQCFHGYPFKSMGKSYFGPQGFAMDRILSFARREAEWDYILSPAPYASPLYRENFNFSGEFLEIGHPRNDVFIRDDAAEYRDKIAERLRKAYKIRDDQKVILFAPTYRDYAAINEFKTERVDFVEPEALSSALGEGYIILLRGHAMNKRAGSAVVNAKNVIDVTQYPEINDLVMLSDMAILDYSSLRFDYAQTGKPMIFFVPDLEEYFANREALMPFEGTAPGPWCMNADELVEAIFDASNYGKKYGAALEQFKERFTPLEDGHASERFMNALFPGVSVE